MRRRVGGSSSSGGGGGGGGGSGSDDQLVLPTTVTKKGQHFGHRRRLSSSPRGRILLYFFLLFVLLVLAVWKLDQTERVRTKVKSWKDKVLGNTANYVEMEAVHGLLESAKPVDIYGNVGDDNTNATGYYVVLLTVGDGARGETYVGVGKSPTSASMALLEAQTKLPRRTNRYPYIKVDIVVETQHFSKFNYFQPLPVGEDPNQEDDDTTNMKKRKRRRPTYAFGDNTWVGLAVDWDTDWVFLPEEVQANALMDKEYMIRLERMAAHATRSRRKDVALPEYSDDETIMDELTIFTTDAVFVDRLSKGGDDITSVRLYHGHRMFPPSLVSADTLLTASRAAGQYLSRSVRESGRMVYLYQPRSDTEPIGYNMARHSGTVYAMACVYRQFQDDAYLLESTNLALLYLKGTVQHCPVPLSNKGKIAKCLVDYESRGHRMSKLGANALAILAFVEYMDVTKTNDHVDLVLSMAEWIMGCQREDGSFVQKVYLGREGSAVHLEQIDEKYFVRYYQGEVAFALTRLWKLAHDNGWPHNAMRDSHLETAKKAVQFNVEKDSTVEDPDLVFDHWLMYGMGELYAAHQKIPSQWIHYAVRSLQVAIKYQNGEMDESAETESRLDHLGVFYDDLSATATATYTEGLCAVHDMLSDLNTPKMGHHIVKAITLSVRYQLQVQYREELALYMRDPQRVLGAFRSSIHKFETRNDFTQHNVRGLLCLARVLEDKNSDIRKQLSGD